MFDQITALISSNRIRNSIYGGDNPTACLATVLSAAISAGEATVLMVFSIRMKSSQLHLQLPIEQPKQQPQMIVCFPKGMSIGLAYVCFAQETPFEMVSVDSFDICITV